MNLIFLLQTFKFWNALSELDKPPYKYVCHVKEITGVSWLIVHLFCWVECISSLKDFIVWLLNYTNTVLDVFSQWDTIVLIINRLFLNKKRELQNELSWMSTLRRVIMIICSIKQNTWSTVIFTHTQIRISWHFCNYVNKTEIPGTL